MNIETIHLARQLLSDEAVELRATLLSAGELPLDLDASEVQFAGFSAVQVLLAAAVSARRNGRALRVVNPSSGWFESLERFGLSSADIESEGALQ